MLSLQSRHVFSIEKKTELLTKPLVTKVFFPKNRGHWKQYSSWEADEHSMKKKKKKGRVGVVEEEELETRFPPDVHVKKGYSWSDQLGIVIAALVEADLTGLVNWTKEVRCCYFFFFLGAVILTFRGVGVFF